MIRSLVPSVLLFAAGGWLLVVSTMCDPRKPGPEPSPVVTVAPSPSPSPSGCQSEEVVRDQAATLMLNCKYHGWITVEGGELARVVDCTPLLRAQEYCWAIFGEPVRATCPVLPEGHPERAACEAVLGPYVIQGGCGQVNANPLQFAVREGQSCRLCAGSVCGEEFTR